MSNPFDWEQFNKNLQEQLPDPAKEIAKPSGLDLSWIEQYVQDALKRAFEMKAPAQMPLSQAEDPQRKTGKTKSVQKRQSSSHDRTESFDLSTEVMELFRSVVVKVHVPEQLNPRRIRIAASANRLRLIIMPYRKTQIVPLPHRVIPNEAKSIFRNDVIEIRLPKNDEGEIYKEIHTDWSD